MNSSIPIPYVIISSIITVFSTLIAVWLNNKAQRGRLEIQIKHDISLKDKELAYDKEKTEIQIKKDIDLKNQQLAYDKEKTEIQISNDNNLKKQDLKREKLENLFILVTNLSKESYFVNHDFINPDNIIDSVFDKTKETQDLHYITKIEMLIFSRIYG